jgi:ribosomal protein S12 methylthiotransferase accessory factor
MPPLDPDRVVDSVTGIVRWVSDIPVDPGEPEIFNCSVKMADTGAYLPLRCFDRNGGAGLTREQARRAGIGEAVERYCASVCFPDELTLGSYRELSRSGRALGPADLPLFHPDQPGPVRYPRFTGELPIAWTTARSATAGDPVRVPACLTFSPFYPFHRDRGEQTIGPSITTGLASALDHRDAVVRGACEVIERDAFNITWLNRLPVPRIAVASAPRLAAVFRERFDRDYLSWSLHALATDTGVPCVLCIVIDHGREPAMVCTGGAAALDPEQAAIKALVEAAQTREWAKFLGLRPNPYVFEADWSNVDDFDKHVLLYAHGDMRHAVEFLLAAPDECRVSDLGPPAPGSADEAHERVLAAVRGVGSELVAADLTSPDVGECGYHVVKAFIPGMVPLEGDHSHRMLGSPRLFDVPRRLGYRPAPSVTAVNPDPHPYP